MEGLFVCCIVFVKLTWCNMCLKMTGAWFVYFSLVQCLKLVLCLELVQCLKMVQCLKLVQYLGEMP